MKKQDLLKALEREIEFFKRLQKDNDLELKASEDRRCLSLEAFYKGRSTGLEVAFGSLDSIKRWIETEGK